MQKRKAKVLHFDDNKGRGILKILQTGERVTVDYKNIKMEGYKVLFEGQIVNIIYHNGELVVEPVEDTNGN